MGRGEGRERERAGGRSHLDKAVVPRCLNRLMDPGFLIPWRQRSTWSIRVSLSTSLNYFCHSGRSLLNPLLPEKVNISFHLSLQPQQVHGTPCRPGLL